LLQFRADGATSTPTIEWRAIACATATERFASSMNAFA